jgi:hypothetical protein
MGFESRMDIWLRFNEYTPFNYLQRLVKFHSKNTFSELITMYNTLKIDDPLQPLTSHYLEQNKTWLPAQNIQFIKNSEETYEAGLRASTHLKPILYHYSWHSFLAFLMYSFLRFNGTAGGHGITVTTMQPEEITLEFHPFKRRGFFQRILDTLTILGYPLFFARWLPVKQKDGTLEENNISSVASARRINLMDIMKFDMKTFGESLTKDKQVWLPNLDWVGWMNDCMKSFVMLHTASTISRYKPNVWAKILEGEKEYTSKVLTSVRHAYDGYVFFVTHVDSDILGRLAPR